MAKFYSASSTGFYDDGINSNMPADVVAVTAAQWQACFDGQGQGQVIHPDATGAPILSPRPSADPKAQASAEIVAIEAKTGVVRVVREFMLGQFALMAAQQGKDPMLLPAYAKLKAVDSQIAALRALL